MTELKTKAPAKKAEVELENDEMAVAANATIMTKMLADTAIHQASETLLKVPLLPLTRKAYS
jgi:hypothetical protein